MTTADDSLRVRIFLRALGNELRRARQRRGWTRKLLAPRLPFKISIQSLATWELASRHITVGRLLELTEALDVHMFDVLAPALSAIARSDTAHGAIQVDLAHVARERRDQLEPLRRWARSRLAVGSSRESTLVTIDRGALQCLAVLCNLDASEVASQLQPFRTYDMWDS